MRIPKTLSAIVTLIVAVWSDNAVAAELAPGTVITAANIDAVSDSTFEGRRVGDMILPVFVNLVKKDGMTIRVGPKKPFEADPRLEELTEKYAQKVVLTPDGKMENFVAGVPFPDISLDDPQGGRKLAYDIVFSGFLGNALNWPDLLFVMVDAKSGYLRRIDYKFSYYQMYGRKVPPMVEGDGKIFSYTTLIVKEPSDLRGIGTFAIRYVDGRTDDIYAYLRSVRRIRRLAGSAWYDPVQGSDLFQDETEDGMNANPGWYKGFRLLGKETLLFPETDQKIYYDPNGKGLARQFPYIAITQPPYWNFSDPTEVWRPHEAYVLEIIPPEGYPMSKKVLYVSTDVYNPFVYEAESYDLKGGLWRLYTDSPHRTKSELGAPVLDPVGLRIIDLQKRTATLLPAGPGRTYDAPGSKASDYDFEALKKLVQ